MHRRNQKWHRQWPRARSLRQQSQSAARPRIPITLWMTAAVAVFLCVGARPSQGIPQAPTGAGRCFWSRVLEQFLPHCSRPRLRAGSWWRWASSSATGEKGARHLAKVAIVLFWGRWPWLQADRRRCPDTPHVQAPTGPRPYRHYAVSVDVGTGTLLIRGPIGPGIAAEVGRQLDANSAIKTVAIDSIGGLIDEALKIAREHSGS